MHFSTLYLRSCFQNGFLIAFFAEGLLPATEEKVQSRFRIKGSKYHSQLRNSFFKHQNGRVGILVYFRPHDFISVYLRKIFSSYPSLGPTQIGVREATLRLLPLSSFNQPESSSFSSSAALSCKEC